jgi:hypothetical protein
MKKRFRYYARNGWDVVEVDRANLYKVYEDVFFGDDLHYRDMRTWCNDRLPKNSWEATRQPNKGTKKFAFKNSKYATMFRLQWL